MPGDSAGMMYFRHLEPVSLPPRMVVGYSAATIMPVVTTAILACESEQLDLLQSLVDATSSARTVLKEDLAQLDNCIRRVRERRPQVLLLDISPRNPAGAIAAVERLIPSFPRLLFSPAAR